MDTFETLAERYQSFNIPRRVLALYHNNKDKIGQAYSFCISQAKQNNHHILYKKLHDEATSKGIKVDNQADYDLGIQTGITREMKSSGLNLKRKKPH